MKTGTVTPKTYTDGTLTYIPLKRIAENPDIPYRALDEDHVAELTASITAEGLISPLLVWNGGGDKGTQVELGESGERVPASFLVAGSHRRAALRSLFKKDVNRFKELFPNGIPCFVVGGELGDVLAAQLKENVMRKDMDPEQIFPVLQKLTRKTEKGGCGLSQSDVAKKIGKSKAWVSQILSIEDTLGEEVVEGVKKKEIGLAEARDVSAKVKKAKKAGKEVDVKEEVAKLKAKAAKRKASGKEKSERRLSAKALWKRYTAMPRRPIGEKVTILESALGYLAGDEDTDLAAELLAENEESEE